jgi:hypothetical protein
VTVKLPSSGKTSPDAHVYEIGGLDDLPIDAVRASLESAHFAIVRGVATAEEVCAAVESARLAFRPGDDHPNIGESPADVRKNFQKWSVGTGGGTHREYEYARLLRVIFTPLLDDDRFGVHDLLRRVAVARNLLLDLPKDFAIDGIEQGLWTAARLQQYPAGGGFIQAHVDKATVNALPSGASSYVQTLMVLTKRGHDFERGGAFLDGPEGRVDLEALVELGDLVVYDERAVHGVADIDPHRVLDTTLLGGRIAGFANLYRTL